MLKTAPGVFKRDKDKMKRKKKKKTFLDVMWLRKAGYRGQM